jgi:hypothetical protein
LESGGGREGPLGPYSRGLMRVSLASS